MCVENFAMHRGAAANLVKVTSGRPVAAGNTKSEHGRVNVVKKAVGRSPRIRIIVMLYLYTHGM